MESIKKRYVLSEMSISELEDLLSECQAGKLIGIDKESIDKIQNEITKRKRMMVVSNERLKAKQEKQDSVQLEFEEVEQVEEEPLEEKEEMQPDVEMSFEEEQSYVQKEVPMNEKPINEEHIASSIEENNEKQINEETYEEEDDDDEKENKVKTWPFILLAIFIIAMAIVAFLFFRHQSLEKAKAESLAALKKELVVELKEGSEMPAIEAGYELTYENKEVKEMANIPDQIKVYIESVPEDADIEVSEIDTNQVGEQQLVFNISKKDEYGQKASNRQEITINVNDTIEPNIILKASSMSLKGDELNKMYENVESVIDPVFGEYRYSVNGENRTYYIDSGEIDVTKSGTYTVYVKVNDNGKIYEQPFVIEYKAVESQNKTDDSKLDDNKNSSKSYPPFFIDEAGNIYSEKDIEDMIARGEIFDVASLEEFKARYAPNSGKTYFSKEEASCLAKGGTWNGSTCSR